MANPYVDPDGGRAEWTLNGRLVIRTRDVATPKP